MKHFYSDIDKLKMTIYAYRILSTIQIVFIAGLLIVTNEMVPVSIYNLHMFIAYNSGYEFAIVISLAMASPDSAL